MPIGAHIITGETLARGVQNNFANSYRRRYDSLAPQLAKHMEMDIPSNLFSPLFAYRESAPYPRRREWGSPIVSRGFRARNYSVTQHAWSIAVKWFEHDRIFDQLKSVEADARQAGENYATRDERVFFQYMTGAADTLLLPNLPNAPDGAALYSATDGAAAARFGVTGGNILTGTGVATAQAIREDFFNACERFAQFQDTEGQPALPWDVIERGVTIYYGIANDQIFREAFVQARPIQFLAGVDATSPRNAAAVTNVVVDSGRKVTLRPTQRITDNDWFVWLDEFDLKPLFSVVGKPLTETVQVPENSDIARSTREEGVYFDDYKTFGANIPWGTVQVNN